MDRLDIHAFADGELGPAEMRQVEAEIKQSPEAARELDAILELKKCLQTKTEAPECREAWLECVGRLNEIDRAKKVETFVGKYAWALCLLLFAVIVSGGLLNRVRGGSVGMGQVAAISSNLVPMGSPARMRQPEQLRNWITDQTGQRPTLSVNPALVEQIAIADQPEGRSVMVRMRDESGSVDLMILPNVRIEDGIPIGGNMFAGQVNGMNCVTWKDSGCQILVLGNRQIPQLQTFARSLYR